MATDIKIWAVIQVEISTSFWYMHIKNQLSVMTDAQKKMFYISCKQ